MLGDEVSENHQEAGGDREDLLLRVRGGSCELLRGGKTVHAWHAPALEAGDPRFGEDALTVSALRAAVPTGVGVSPAALAKLGNDLTSALFGGPVPEVVLEAMKVSKGRRRLLLDVEGSNAAIPWEYLRVRGQALVRSGMVVVRHHGDTPRPEALELGPIERIAFASANPERYQGKRLETFDGDAHRKAITGALNEHEIGLTDLTDVTKASLKEALTTQRNLQGLHFLGHGIAATAERPGALLVKAKTGNAEAVTGEELASWLQQSKVRFVVLGACHSGSDGAAEFGDVARQIVHLVGIPVVAMQMAVPQSFSTAFVAALYRALGRSWSLEAAFYDARINTYEEDYAFGIPVLHGNFLDAPAKASPAPEPIPLPLPPPEEQQPPQEPTAPQPFPPGLLALAASMVAVALGILVWASTRVETPNAAMRLLLIVVGALATGAATGVVVHGRVKIAGRSRRFAIEASSGIAVMVLTGFVAWLVTKVDPPVSDGLDVKLDALQRVELHGHGSGLFRLQAPKRCKELSADTVTCPGVTTLAVLSGPKTVFEVTPPVAETVRLHVFSNGRHVFTDDRDRSVPNGRTLRTSRWTKIQADDVDELMPPLGKEDGWWLVPDTRRPSAGLRFEVAEEVESVELPAIPDWLDPKEVTVATPWGTTTMKGPRDEKVANLTAWTVDQHQPRFRCRLGDEDVDVTMNSSVTRVLLPPGANCTRCNGCSACDQDEGHLHFLRRNVTRCSPGCVPVGPRSATGCNTRQACDCP